MTATDHPLYPPEDPIEERTVVVHDVRAVLSDRVLDDATITISHGRIVAVEQSVSRPPGAVNGHGLLCLPGLVDTHSDGLEKEISPRRQVRMPVDFALRSFEGRVRAAGITTIHHGVGFEDQERYGRSIALANEMCSAIAARRISALAAVDHRVLFRLEARSLHGAEALMSRLREQVDIVDGGPAAGPLVSFEDHTPGQGQYRDVEVFKAAIEPGDLADGESVDDFVDRLMGEARRLRDVIARNRSALGELGAREAVRLLAHDCEDANAVAEAAEWGAVVIEFPLSTAAATEARRRDLAVVMGAPNALRGRSHNDNASAMELVAGGLCTALASDYLPSALLAAAFRLARERVVSLPEAVALITSGPARVAGLPDRGSIAVDRRADLILVSDAGPWPQVVAVHRAADGAGLGLPPVGARP